jgi:GMP synthase-like glutamine amidotransferase
MTIGILQTGHPPASLQTRFGAYADMFKALLGADRDYAVFDVEAGELPSSARVCEAYLVTGSSAGVYDDLPWIAPLEGFLREAKGKAKLVGVCFGHQIMAQALGGRAEKSSKGWGLGLHHYAVAQPARWMDGGSPIALPASHQDQVTALPPGARVLGGNAFCPNGLLVYEGDDAISIQAHPEFSAEFAKALLDRRLLDPALAGQAQAAIHSLDAPNDNHRVGGWLKAFLSDTP